MKIWTTLILSWLLLSVHASAGVLEKKGCGSCHRLHSKEKNTSSTAPDLYYAGNKFQSKWLRQFLKNPDVIRPAGFITDPGLLQAEDLPPHPSFTEQEAITLTEQLISLKISKPALVGAEPLSKGLRAKIKYQFERTFGCISCHQSLNLAGKVRGGISGPSLVDAGNRLQADWIADWLNRPEVYKMNGRMPRYKMDSTTLDQLTRFLMTLKKENIK
jgi:mono/diheme cytochrome c family protein